MDSKISVIVPVYNVEAYLEQCIQSLLEQTYYNLEIILVDDGSTDKSGEICDAFAVKDDRIIVLHQKNAGLSAARNYAMKRATGEYIAFVDSDDYIDKTMYEVLLKTMIEESADVTICHENAFQNGKQPNENQSEEYRIEAVENGEEYRQHFLDEFRGPFMWVWNKLYKREIIDNLKFVEGKKVEDIFYTADLVHYVHKVVWINQRLYYYRQRSESIMGVKDDKLLTNYGEAILNEWQKIGKKSADETFGRRHYENCLTRIAQLETLAWNQRTKKAQQILRKMFLDLYREENGFGVKKDIKFILARYFRPVYHVLKGRSIQI